MKAKVTNETYGSCAIASMGSLVGMYAYGALFGNFSTVSWNRITLYVYTRIPINTLYANQRTQSRNCALTVGYILDFCFEALISGPA
jgi:hypothetical protein